MSAAGPGLDTLLRPPFDLEECSWPAPAEVAGNPARWISAPTWDAPVMPYRPQPRWDLVDHMPIWTIDWQDFFRSLLQLGRIWPDSAQTRGFHIVFRIRLHATGQLAIWSDDGCIVRRGAEVLIEDRARHDLTRHVIAVTAGETLEIAHWQHSARWSWGAGLLPAAVSAAEAGAMLEPFLERVGERLHTAEGPPIKMLTDGRNPYRAVIAAYSMILNGSVPSAFLLFGDHQWPASARACLEQYLPFAGIVATDDIYTRLEALGGSRLAAVAQRYWYVMKACIELLEPPLEYCTLDDDVFVLGSLSDALAAYATHDYVFTPDVDLADDYYRVWGQRFPRRAPIATGAANTGFCWRRQRHDRQEIAAAMVAMAPERIAAAQDGHFLPEWIWQQGIVNVLQADDRVFALPSNRYPCMKLDGLPGGLLGYDYARNPCGFAAVHFAGGWYARPTDLVSLALAPAILGQRHGRHAE